MEPPPQYNLPSRTYNSSALQTWPVTNHSFGVHPNVSSQQYQRPQQTGSRPRQDPLGLSLHQRQHRELGHQTQLPLPSPQLQLPAQNHGQHHDHAQAHAPPTFVQSYSAQQFHHYEQALPEMAPHSLSSPLSQSGSRTPSLSTTIVRTKSANQGPCRACGRLKCNLASHRYFSKHVVDTANRKVPQAEFAHDKTPCQSTAVPISAASTPIDAALPQLLLDPEREYLLNLWSHPWSPTNHSRAHALESHLFPTRFIDRALPVARAHPPLLQAVLAYSGTLFAIAHNKISDTAWRQQSFAVQLLSQACPTEQDASTDEAMLAATLLLLVYMAQGNDLEIRKHVSGLVHLATVRGGLHYLGLGGLVSDTLMYADMMQAIFFNTEPVWAVPLPPLDVGPSVKMGSGFRDLLSTSQGIDPPLLLAAESVCKVATIFQWTGEHPTDGPPKPIRNGLSYLSMIAPYQLARCNAMYHNTGTVDECICLALILLHHVVLRNDGTITPAMLQVEYQFWQALEQAASNGVMAGVAPRLYVWMCFMGATVSLLLADSGRTRFSFLAVEKLRQVQTKARVVDWESVRSDVLEEFCWVGVVQEELFRTMWTEVEHLNITGIHANGVAQPPSAKQNFLPPAG